MLQDELKFWIMPILIIKFTIAFDKFGDVEWVTVLIIFELWYKAET